MYVTPQDGSDLYLLADELSKKFEERIKAAKLDVGPARADKSIPYGFLGAFGRSRGGPVSVSNATACVVSFI